MYTAVSEETTDGPAPDYDEIIDGERGMSKAIACPIPVPDKAQPDSNDYCGTPHPPGENNNNGTIVRL